MAEKRGQARAITASTGRHADAQTILRSLQAGKPTAQHAPKSRSRLWQAAVYYGAYQIGDV
jgi:hypothetical protein